MELMCCYDRVTLLHRAVTFFLFPQKGMSLWIKRAQAEVGRRNSLAESLSRVMPMPFEERRGRVGMVPYNTFRWFRYLPWVVCPGICIGVMLESRDVPTEHCFTPLHVWLADHGFFRHDTIKALNPSFDQERIAAEHSNTDRKWRFTGADLLSEREVREFAAMTIEKQRLREGLTHSSS